MMNSQPNLFGYLPHPSKKRQLSACLPCWVPPAICDLPARWSSPGTRCRCCLRPLFFALGVMAMAVVTGDFYGIIHFIKMGL